MSVDAAEQELEENRIEYDELPATSHYLSLERGEYGSSASNCYAAGEWN